MSSSLRNYAIIFLLFPYCFGLFACVRCSKEKYAIYIPKRNIIQLHDDGVIMSPLTPEGAFPEQNNVLTIILKAPFNDIVGKRLKVGKEITILYNYAVGGYVELLKNSIEVNLKYSNKYWANHNGIIPLRIAELEGSQI